MISNSGRVYGEFPLPICSLQFKEKTCDMWRSLNEDKSKTRVYYKAFILPWLRKVPLVLRGNKAQITEYRLNSLHKSQNYQNCCAVGTLPKGQDMVVYALSIEKISWALFMFRITDRSGKSSSYTRRVWVSALQRTSGLSLSTGKKRNYVCAFSFRVGHIKGIILGMPPIFNVYQCIRPNKYTQSPIQMSDERPESDLFLDFSSPPPPESKHHHISFWWNFLNLLELSTRTVASKCSITTETIIIVGDSQLVSLNWLLFWWLKKTFKPHKTKKHPYII